MNKGRIFIFSGPSGSGKSTILAKVLENDPTAFFSISATTRNPRPGEVNGVNYHFVSKEVFEDMIKNDKLLEYAQYVDNYYGTPSTPVFECVEAGRDVIIEVEVQGFEQLRTKLPEAISIFIAPPSMEILEERLRNRSTETEEKIVKRITTAKKEMEYAKLYNHTVINSDLQTAIKETLDIINNNH